MTTTITLYCHSINKTNGNFVIWPDSKHDEILQDTRLVFGIDYAAVYDIRAQPINNLLDCVTGDIVQVAATENERVLYYSPRDCIMYSGEEIKDVTNEWVDGYGLPWKRCEHIMSLGAKPQGFVLDNTIRITRPYGAVLQELKDIAAATPEDINTAYNAGMAIFSNWGMKWEVVLPASMNPDNVDDMSANVLSLLVVLSSFTQGSARRVCTYIVEAVNARVSHLEEGETKNMVLRPQDVVHVISTLYDKTVVWLPVSRQPRGRK